jgi:hypothetical protein
MPLAVLVDAQAHTMSTALVCSRQQTYCMAAMPILPPMPHPMCQKRVHVYRPSTQYTHGAPQRVL